jgi:hypothetical protein
MLGGDKNYLDLVLRARTQKKDGGVAAPLLFYFYISHHPIRPASQVDGKEKCRGFGLSLSLSPLCNTARLTTLFSSFPSPSSSTAATAASAQRR